MAEFNKDKLEMFLGVVRKYMQVRGPMSQKELAEAISVGVSTMSRFMSLKTTDINPQLIAKITAKLNIPLHEIVDFVEENYTDHFIKLVKLYKDEDEILSGAPLSNEAIDENVNQGRRHDDVQGGSDASTAKRNVNAKVKIGGKTSTIAFRAEGGDDKEEPSIKEKLEALTPRQKAYMQDFLSLDMEGKDLIVDLGNNLFRYFRQKGMDF
jgi:transcriptional regulator with XRE-family HTH domain